MAALLSLVAFLTLGIASRRFVRARCETWALAPFAPGTLTAAITLGVFVSVTAVVGRIASSFDAGIGAAAVVGIALFVLTRKLEPAPLPRASKSTERWVLVIALGFVALYGNLSFRYQMHDEHAVYGHKSMVEQFRRGVYPLYYPSSPDEEARYHYGFDILAGVFTRGFDLNSDLAIDLVCILLALMMCWGAAAVACDEDAERSAPFAAIAIHLGAGLAFLLLAGVEGRHPRCLTQYHHPSCNVELFPTQIMNVFQHPVSMGVPLLLAAVLLFSRVAGVKGKEPLLSKGHALTILATTLVLGALSVGQFVYYALGGLAALAALPAWRFKRPPYAKSAIALVAALGLSFVLAYAIGGMLAPNSTIDPNLVRARAVWGFPPKESFGGIMWHHAVNLGLGFLLLPWFVFDGLKTRRPAVLLLTAFGIGGILVAHLFNYSRSWDIVKFPSAASFALSLVFVLVVDRFFAKMSHVGAVWARRIGGVLLCGSGALAAIFILFPLDGANRLYSVGRWTGDAVVRQCIDWLRDHDYESKDVVYAQSNVAMELSVFGGLSVVAEDTDLYYMGVKNSELQRMRRLSNRIRSTLDPKALEELGVRYLVFSEEEIDNLGPPARRAIRAGKGVEKLVSFESSRPRGTRSIWRVRPRTSPDPG